jgi:hypothetical protein
MEALVDKRFVPLFKYVKRQEAAGKQNDFERKQRKISDRG